MKAETKRIRRREDVREDVRKTDNEIQKTQEGLGRERDDIVVTRETLEQIEGGGTEEGAAEVFESVEKAEEAATELFDEDSETLEQTHAEGQESAEDLEEGSESVERDVETIRDAAGRVNTRENLRELEEALDRARNDKDFLDRHIERLEETIRQSEDDYQELYAEVHGAVRPGEGV